MAGSWRRSRQAPPEEVLRLVRELRLYQDRAELSMQSLAAKTGYSRSSWQRCLTARSLPPWEAVDALGRLGEADRAALRVRWEAAVSAWAAPAAPSAVPAREPRTAPPAGSPEPPEAPAGVTRRTPPLLRSRVAVTAVVAAAAACTATAVLLLGPWGPGARRAGAPAGAPPGAPAWPWALHFARAGSVSVCGPAGCAGQDPYRERCVEDAVAVHRLTAYGRTLTLRYSPVCHASWAEVQPAEGTSGLLVASSDGDRRAARAGAGWTGMTNADPGAVRAAVVVDGHQLGVSRTDSWVDRVGPVTAGTGPE